LGVAVFVGQSLWNGMKREIANADTQYGQYYNEGDRGKKRIAAIGGTNKAGECVGG
jgi:hypothetical protein